MLALMLVGGTAAPLVPCTGKSDPARCPMEMAQEPDHVACHDTETPPAQMSCCCTARESSVPPNAADSRLNAEAPLSTAPAFGEAEPARRPHRVVETTTNRTHARPLFTLFSAFLI